MQSDPEVVHESLYNQMEKLTIQPLQESGMSTVIVIDALDECKDDEPASAILSVLGRLVSKISKVKFFLTGRPESQIHNGFHLFLLKNLTDTFILHGVRPSLVNRDIQIFFEQRFKELVQHWPGLDNWPGKEQIELLCQRAAGLFVYAIATMKFINHRTKNPKVQLNRLLQLPESSTYEARTEFRPNLTLDQLYTSILEGAFEKDDPEDDLTSQSFIGAVVLAANPLSPSSIARLLNFEPVDVYIRLSSIHSLLILQNIDDPTRPFHKSFPDFITDST